MAAAKSLFERQRKVDLNPEPHSLSPTYIYVYTRIDTHKYTYMSVSVRIYTRSVAVVTSFLERQRKLSFKHTPHTLSPKP